MSEAIELFDQGVAHVKADELDLAIEVFSEAIVLDPELAVAHNGRGVTYAIKGDLEKAIADCTEAIRLEPENPLFYRTRARIFQEIGQESKAEADLAMHHELHSAKK